MGGKSKPVIGFHYRPAWHMGLCIGPIDALLEFRSGDQTAWSGRLTASGTVDVNQPNLFGGEKDQGGVVGTLALLNGEPTQQPDPYLIQTFGDQVPAWRGLATVVWRGGRYGAMNPYPQKASYKVEVNKAHWDAPGCWYPEKARVLMDSGVGQMYDFAGNTAHTTPGYNSSEATVVLAAAETCTIRVVANPTNAYTYFPAAPELPRRWYHCGINVSKDGGSPTNVYPTEYDTAAEANAAAANAPYTLTGPGTFTLYLVDDDDAADDNLGALQFGVWKRPPLYGMNPAHILYFARTQSTMGRRPRACMDDANMRAAAEWFYDQCFGLCPEYDASQESIDDFIARIGKTAGCALNIDHATGLYRIDIANGVYDLSSLPIITDDDIIEWSMQPATLSNAVNSVSVEYTDPGQKATVVTPPLEATALVNAFGRIHQDVTYDAIPTASLATRVAQRELLNTVTPTHGFNPTCTPRVASSLLANQYFRLQAPKHGITDMVCIVGDVDTGTLKSGAVRLTGVENIYSLPATAFADVETGVDTRRPSTPVPAVDQRVVEAPYVDIAGELPAQVLASLDDDAAFVEAIAVDPSDSRNFTLQIAPHGSGAFADVADGEWCPSALIVEGDMLQDAGPATDFTLTDGKRLAQVQVGSIALWGNELCRVDAIDVGAATLTLGRGCADTVPTAHAVSSRIYLYGDAAAYDNTQFTAGESIDARLLSNTGSAQLDPSLASVSTIDLSGRMTLPYPPGLLRIDGEPYPSTVSGQFAVTWAHRNRLSQADQLIDTSMGSVTPADNVRYRLTLLDASGNILVTRDDIGPATATVELVAAGDVTLELSTIDPHGESQQKHAVTFAYTPATTPPTQPTITAVAYTPVYDGIIYDGGDAGTGTGS